MSSILTRLDPGPVVIKNFEEFIKITQHGFSTLGTRSTSIKSLVDEVGETTVFPLANPTSF